MVEDVLFEGVVLDLECVPNHPTVTFHLVCLHTEGQVTGLGQYGACRLIGVGVVAWIFKDVVGVLLAVWNVNACFFRNKGHRGEVCRSNLCHVAQTCLQASCKYECFLGLVNLIVGVVRCIVCSSVECTGTDSIFAGWHVLQSLAYFKRSLVPYFHRAVLGLEIGGVAIYPLFVNHVATAQG